jgi:hypothetical protein
MVKNEPWAKGSMKFTDDWAKPWNVTMDEWVKMPGGRTWVSKRGELPSQFIARVLRDMERGGAQITDCLLDEIAKFRKREK